MATYTLKNVKFLETSDYEFQVQFSYNGLLLTTNAIARGATQQELEKLMAITAGLAEQKRSDDNFTGLKQQYDGKPQVTVSGA